MAIALMALVLICIGSVSATDETVDCNLTVNDNSQNIDEISELNDEVYTGDIVNEDNTVSVNNEKELLTVSNEDVLGADSTLTLVSGSTTPNVGDTVYLKMSNEASQYLYDYGQTVYIRNDGSEYSTTIYRTAISDAGAPVTFNEEGTYNIQFCVFTNNANFYTNSLKFTVGSGSNSDQISSYNEGSDGSDLPEYYIRFYDKDEDAFIDVQFLDDWTEVTATMWPKIFRADGGNDFSAVYPEYASSTAVRSISDGSTNMYTCYLMKNGSTYNYPSNYQLSFSASNVGIHQTYAYYTYNGVTYYSNVYYFFVGLPKTNYQTVLSLFDKNNPENKTVSYKVGDEISITNLLSNSQLGENIKDYLITRTIDNNDYVLENLEILLNDEVLYKHGIGSLYSQKGDGIIVNPSNNAKNGFSLSFDTPGWYNLTAKYYGNSLGLSESISETLHILVKSDVEKQDITLDVEVNEEIDQENTYVSQYNDIMTFKTTSESDISGEIIYKEGDVELGRADLGEEFDISTLTKGTHTITAYWAGNDDYNPAEYVFNVIILEKNIYFDLYIDDVVYPDHAIGRFSANVIGVYTITINGKEYTVNYDEEYEESAEFNIDQLPIGTYDVSNVVFEDMENYQIDFDDEEMNDLPSFEVYDKVPTSIYVELDKNSIKKGESIVITVSVENEISMEEITVGNVLIYDDNNPEIAIIDLSKTNNYTFTPSYSGSEDSIYIYVKYLGYDELNYNSSDDDYDNYWIEAPEIKDTTVSVDIDKTSLSNGETITVTPTVLVDDEEINEGTVEFYNENDDKIGEIDLNEKTSFEYTVTGEAGSHSIWAKYVANDLYAESSSDKKDYKIKSALTITLARNDDAIVVVGDTVYFTITFSDSVSDNLELWVNDNSLGGEDGTSSTSVTFDSSYIGENDVFIKFLGNDDFEATESNKVTVNVIKALDTTVTIELSPDAVLPNKNMTITPTVKDSEGNVLTTGVVRIYTDAYMNSDPVAVINAGETGNYSDTKNYPGYTGYLYAVYVPSDRTYNRSPVSAGAKYTLLYSNKLDLTVNSATEITVNDGVSFDILATLTNGDGEITLYINDKANITLTKNTETPLTLPVGDYTIYAEYARGSDNYDSATSNTVTVHVVEKVKNEITVTVESVTLPNQAEIKVTATVDGEYTIDVNGTEVKVTVDGGSGSKFVSLAAGDYYANVTGQEDAIITNAVFTVSPEPKIAELIIRDANYPENATIIISGKGNVTITIEYYLESSVKDSIISEIIFDGGVKKQVDAVNGVYTPVTFVVNETGEFTVNAKYKVYSFSTGELYVDAENTLTYSVTIIPQAKDISLDVVVDEEKEEDDYYTLDWGDSAFEVVTTASEDIDAEIIYKEGDKVLGRAKIGEVFEINPNDLGLGEHTITATLEGNEDYDEANYTFTLEVSVKTIWFTLEIDNVTYPDHAVGKFYSDVDGKYTITINGEEYEVNFVWTDEDEPVSFDIKQLPVGTYTPSSIIFEDLEHYEFGESERDGQNVLPTFSVKGEVVLNDSVLSVVNGTAPAFSIDLPGASGNLTVTVDGKNYTKGLVDGKATVEITDLPAGNYSATVTYTGDETHKSTSVPASFKVEEKTATKEDVVLNDSVLSVVNGTAPIFSIDLPGASGNLTVTVDGKNYTKGLVDGKATVEITDLPAGNYSATVTYTGDETHKSTSVPASFKVDEKETPDANKTLDVNVPEGSTTPVFSINLPSNATGNLTVIVDGKKYTKELVNGSASIAIDNLAPGAHNVTVSYSGDKNYPSMSKNTTVTIPTPKLTNNKNINTVYSANAYYKVRVTANGKAVVGEKVSIKFNGKTYTVKTDKNGYATLKLPTKIKVKKYTITATFKGVKVSNKITIKHLIKAKNLKAKKSKKVLKIKVKTNKVNGKFLKGKKLKLKLKGKTLKAKINKKGVATFKVKKNILKKLKVGKKYTFKVTYGKDTVSKKIKIKR